MVKMFGIKTKPKNRKTHNIGYWLDGCSHRIINIRISCIFPSILSLQIERTNEFEEKPPEDAHSFVQLFFKFSFFLSLLFSQSE